MRTWIAAIALGLAVASCGGSGNRPEPAAPVPGSPRYAVPADVGTLVVDAAAFAAVATPARADLEAAPPTKDTLFLLAMLDALDGRWTEAVARLDQIRELETNPTAKLMMGLSIRTWADAIAHEGDTPDGFRAAFERGLAALPIDQVRDQLRVIRSMGIAFSPELCRKLLAKEVGPRVKDGAIGMQELHAVVFMRYAVVRLVPVGPVIDKVLAARGIEPMQ